MAGLVREILSSVTVDSIDHTLRPGLETIDILRHHFHPVLAGSQTGGQIEIIVFALPGGIGLIVLEAGM